MKRFLLILTTILTSVSAAWAEDYSQGYYTMSPGADATYFGYYDSNNSNSKYGGTKTRTNAIVFTFEKTTQDNVYYWYDCNNKKYIYADNSGYLKVAEDKSTNNDNYKWFIKENNDGTLTIADMTTYNGGNPVSGLIQLSSVGGLWASKCSLTSNDNQGKNTWKLNLLMKKNTPYFISFKREWRKNIFSAWQTTYRYLQYESSTKKMKQNETDNKDVSYVWYINDVDNGEINLFTAQDAVNAMGYASNESAGADKISTSNSTKSFSLRQSDNSDYPIAFLSNAGNTPLYISNHGGKDQPYMGLYETLEDDGSRFKVEEADKYDVVIVKPEAFTENPTVTCNVTGYYGQTVQNGGSIYVGKGTTLTTGDLTISNYLYYSYSVSIENKIITVEYTYHPNREISVPQGYNGYIGGITTIGEAEWKTKEYWTRQDTWNDAGPGCLPNTGEGMWSPIYLKDVTASGINFEGWKLRLKLVNSELSANTSKFHTNEDGIVTIDVDETSRANLTMSGDNADPGLHTFNIDGELTINTNSQHFTNESNDNQINLGKNGKFYFKASSAVTHNRSFTINVTPTEPANYNVVESQENPFAVFTNVTLSNLTFSATNPEKWTKVNSYDELSTQTGEGFYYYIEEVTPSNGVKQYTLHTYKQIVYDVPNNTTETLSNIDNHENIRYFNVPEGSKIAININDFDLTRIQGAGEVVLDVNTSITSNKSTVATGKLTINEGKILTIGSGDTQTNSIASFSSIELAGTIKTNNSTTTLNNVTVPSNKTGKIHAYDMGSTDDGFQLAGTTTLNGKLIVSNTYNLQLKVDELTGTSELEIRGNDWAEEDFNIIHTKSIDPAVVNIVSASDFTGTINVNNSEATVTVSGHLSASTIKKTVGTLNYDGTTLDGTTLDGVILGGSTYITTSGEVTIKNLAGNNVGNNTHKYAFVGSNNNCTIKFIGTCDLTKKSDGSTANDNAKVGYNSSSKIVIEENANVKVVALFNTVTDNNNAAITVNRGATVTCTGTSNYLYSTSLQGSGNIILSAFPTASAHPTFNEWTGTIEFADGGSNSTNLTTLFNAWGNSNSTIKLNNVTGGYLLNYDPNNPTTTAVNPTLNILADKTLILNNGNSGANARISKVTGAGTIDRQGWTSSNNHNLYITTLTNFTGTLKGTGHPIIVENLVRTLGPTVDERLFKTSGTVHFSKSSPYNSKLYIGDEDKTAAYAWEEKTVSSVKGYYIKESAKAKIEAAKNSVSPRTIGTGVGEYAVSFNGQSYTNEVEFTSAVNALTALDNWTGVTDPTFTINQPTSGYYKIKSKFNENTGYYLSCQNVGTGDTNAQQITTPDKNTIFYIEIGNTNSTIKSYSTGYLFGEYSRANYTSPSNNPVKWTFSEGANIGTYTLTSNAREVYNNNTYSQILYGWSGATDKNSIVQIKADRNSEKDNNGHTDWILIPVAKEELPVIPAPGVTDATKPVLLGNITSTNDVTNNITVSAKIVDLSDATIGANIDEIKTAVESTNPNAIIIAPEGTSVASTTTNVLLTTNTENTYTCNNLQLNDDVIAQFTDETNFKDTKVTYSRAATTSSWGTIYLPYAPKTEEGVSYYELTASNDNSLTFTKVETPAADTPYMYKKTSEGDMTATNTSAKFSLGGDTDPHEGSSVNSYQLVGILTNSSVVGDNEIPAKVGYNKIVDPNAYYFKNTDNTFRPLPASNIFSMKAFRCYLTTSTSARQNILSFNYEDNDQPTGVSIIESEDGKTVDVIFDLNGRRLQNAKKGINIINGKKVIK